MNKSETLNKYRKRLDEAKENLWECRLNGDDLGIYNMEVKIEELEEYIRDLENT